MAVAVETDQESDEKDSNRMREVQHFEIRDPKMTKEQFKLSVTDADDGKITVSFQNPETNEIWTSE